MMAEAPLRYAGVGSESATDISLWPYPNAEPSKESGGSTGCSTPAIVRRTLAMERERPMTAVDASATARPVADVDGGDVIDVRDLRMRYGSTDVLNGVTFRARRGEVLALLGPNGAGKTTTIEILEGFRMRS